MEKSFEEAVRYVIHLDGLVDLAAERLDILGWVDDTSVEEIEKAEGMLSATRDMLMCAVVEAAICAANRSNGARRELKTAVARLT